MQIQKHGNKKQMKHDNHKYKTGEKFKDNYYVSICESPDT